jgi:hypothetical protein
MYLCLLEHANYSYLGDVTIDLSQVMFIATANSLDTISPPLLDRCEIIECSGYVTDEKLAIAKKFLLPRQIKECGLEEGKVVMQDDALLRVILDYTGEVRLHPVYVTDGRLVFDRLNEKSGKSAAQRLSNSLPIPPSRTTRRYLLMILRPSLVWPSMTRKFEKRNSGLVLSRV